ncbi:hypothetical protein [Yinghuangia sp. YIM S09857]|uniref:hypothetical protein n=1 Tax=Yinghuangia sp. YIM S09857 TaxID=3436929 RepID=UPI003F5291BE
MSASFSRPRPHRARLTSAATAGVLAAATGAGLVLAVAPAVAVPVPYTAKCVDQTAPEKAVPDALVDVDIQVSPAKPAYRVGDEVTVTWVWKTYPKVPADAAPNATASPEAADPPDAPAAAPGVVPADSTLPKGQIVVGGAQGGSVAVAGERKNPEAPAGTELRLTDMTGKLRLTAAGQVSLAPGDFARFTANGAAEAETRCTPVSPTAVSTMLTVEGDAAPPTAADTPAAPADPTLAADRAAVAPGGLVALNGTAWPAGAPEVSLCAADGGRCDTAGVAANTVAVADGRLTGTATLNPAAAPGNYTLKVAIGPAHKAVPVAVTAVPQTLTATPASGPVGTVVKLVGSGFTPGGTVVVRAAAADGTELGGGVEAPVGPDGTFSADLPVADPATAMIRAHESGSAATASATFTVTPAPGQIPAEEAPAPGTLSMTQAGTAVDFGGATLDGTAKTLDAALNRITVTDSRDGALGWSLTGTMTDLAHTGGSGAIPAGNVAWTPNCAALPGSSSEVVSGVAGPLSSTAAASLCTQAPGTPGAESGGTFTADAGLTLTTPEFAAAGTYSGTLTLTLV